MTSEIRQAGMRAACALSLGLTLVVACARVPDARDADGVTVPLASDVLVLDETTTREVDAALEAAGSERGVHAIVVPPTPPTLDEIEALHARGVVLLNRVGDRALLVSITGASVEQALGLGTRAARIPPRAKLSDELRRRVDADPNAPERVEVTVQFHDDVTDVGRITAQLPPGASRWLGQTWRVVLRLSDVFDVAALDEVTAVAEVPERRRSGAVARAATRTDDVQVLVVPQDTFTGRSGAGIRIGLIDYYGMDPDHPDFLTADGSSTRVMRHVPSDATSLHAMKMAMAAAGNGSASVASGFGPRANRGHAAEALLSNVENFDEQDSVRLLHDDDVHVVVTGDQLEPGGRYGVFSSEVDRVVRGDAVYGTTPLPARPHVWAAGNSGFEEGHASLKISAKNAIVVGSTDAVDDAVSLFSSRGPTYDGRLKPDVVAPGAIKSIVELDGDVAATGLMLAGPNAQKPYDASDAGSSFAAPAVAGILALVMEEFAAQGVDPRTLAPSTYRALLAATATDLASTVATSGGGTVTYHEGPDHATGHGLVDAVEAVGVAKDPLRWSEITLVEPHQQISSTIFLPEGVDELVVALAWDDRPGSPWAAAPALVYDLDVRVTSPFGQTLFPSTIEPPDGGPVQPATASARDARNTLEVVRIAAPPAGAWIVTVEARWLGLGCSQVASLVTSHPHLRLAWIELPPFQPLPSLEWIADLIEPIAPHAWQRRRDDGTQTWVWPSGAIMPLDLVILPPQICLLWTLTPLVELEVDDLPPDAEPVAFDERGTLDVDVERSGRRARVRFTRRDVTRPVYLALTDATGRPWPDDLRPRITVRSPPPPERRR